MEGEQLEDRRIVGENSCNSGDGTDQTGPILDVYDDDDDDILQLLNYENLRNVNLAPKSALLGGGTVELPGRCCTTGQSVFHSDTKSNTERGIRATWTKVKAVGA